MSKALLIVDVQNDFTEGGTLGVVGGDEIARGITRLLAAQASDYDLIIASRDWHDAEGDNGGHFASGEPDYIQTWPVHCVAGSTGAEYDPDLDTTAITHHLTKGQGVPAYSAFEGITETGGTLSTLLDEHGALDLDVVGIATDYCVRASVLDAIGHGRRVRVFTDLIAAVATDSGERALTEMAHEGAELREAGV